VCANNSFLLRRLIKRKADLDQQMAFYKLGDNGGFNSSARKLKILLQSKRCQASRQSTLKLGKL
jgi:hypothetical protein